MGAKIQNFFEFVILSVAKYLKAKFLKKIEIFRLFFKRLKMTN